MADIIIRKGSNVQIVVDAEPSIRMGLTEHFSRFVNGYRFHPKVKAGVWDGKIRFLNYQTGRIYAGLIQDVIEYAKENGYKVSIDPDVKEMFHANVDVEGYLDGLKLSAHGKEIELRDYQRNAVVSSITQKRRLIQSPTSSGKSSIIYSMCRVLLDEVFDNERILIVVPTIGLVTQLRNDFRDYSSLNGWNVDDHVTCSTDKNVGPLGRIHITTWQSIYKKDSDWFDSFRCLMVDEAHQAKAASLVAIANNCNAEFRYGLSGSIDSEDETTDMTLRGIFGFKYVTTTTKKLMEDKTIAHAVMNCIHLTYEGDTIKPKTDYQKEIQWLAQSEERNNFIVDLANNLEGNVLVLFSLVEKHGKPLRDMMKASKGKDVYFVYGGVAVDDREKIRQMAERHKGCIILASYQTFSTGVNIRNIHHIVFASPTKSFTRVIQSIGRGLRTSETKTSCQIWDLFDQLYGDDKQSSSFNHTFRHFLERIKIYIKEGFEYTINKHKI